MLARSRAVTLLALILLALIALGIRLQQKKQWKPPSDWIPDISEITGGKKTVGHNCTDRLPWPDLSIVDGPVQYARQQIIVRPKESAQRKSVTKVEQSLFPEVQEIDWLGDPEATLRGCQDPIILDVPAFPREPVNASHVLFGMSTTLERLDDSIRYLERWIANTGARLYVIVKGPDETTPDAQKMIEVESKMHDLGIEVTISKPLNRKDVGSQRYFSTTRLTYSNRDESTRWITAIDDDTFFPSMPSLLEMLEEHDATKEWYLGGLSEEWWSVARYGLMGFGGAGVFISKALAEVMDANYDDCRAHSDTGSGDVAIMECVYKYSRAKLTQIPELHQFDLGGDVSGLYESGRLPLSLHHWKRGWWDERDGPAFPIVAMHLVSDICGDCFLQRWQFNGDLILSNGYSIAIYPTGALNRFETGMDLSKVENTWAPLKTVDQSVNRGTDHDVGPDRPKLELERDKIQYRFLDAVKVDGGVRQFYHHYGLEGELDTILELYWTEYQEESDKSRSEQPKLDADLPEDFRPDQYVPKGSGAELHSYRQTKNSLP